MKQCRICFGEELPESLISPCQCTGYSKYVHRHCLDKWRKVAVHASSRIQCNVCNVSLFWVDLSGLLQISTTIYLWERNLISRYSVLN